MNLRRTALRCLVALAVAFASAGAPGQEAPGRKTLRFIGNASLPPVVFSDQGQARGVAVDLVAAAAREAGLEVRIEAMNWQQAQAEMREGRADALIHINPTPERLQTLAFSAPLLESRFHIFRRADRAELQDMASLAGRRVGVERAGFPAQYLASHPQVQVEFVPSWKVAFERLGRGELDAVFVDRWAGDYALAQAGATSIVAVEPPLVQDRSSVAVAKGRPELLDALNRGLAAIDANGTRQAILQRWSGQEVVHLTRESLERDIIAAVAAIATIGGLLTLAYVVRLRRLNRALAGARDAQAQAWREATEAFAELNSLYNDSPIGLHSLAPDGTVLRINDTELAWLGRQRDAVVGRMNYADLLAEHCRSTFRESMALLERTEVVKDLLCELAVGDGRTSLPVVVNARAVRDAAGAIVGVVGTARDRSAEVRSAQELERSEQRYRAVVDSQSELIYRLRADGTLLLANPQFCKAFGVEAPAVVGQAWTSRAHPDDQERVASMLRELSPQHPVVVIEQRVITAARGTRWMEFINQGFFDEAGRLVELQCVGRDVHERKQLEEELAQALQVRQAMLDNDLVGIMTARDRRIVWANPAFERLMGYGPGELVGMSTRTGYPSDAAYESFGAQAYTLLMQGKRFAQRAEYVRKDGTRMWADASGAPLSEPGLSLWVFIDVTARHLAEEELHRHRENLEALVEERTAELTAAVELAEAANRAKGVFLATMSHELRTPLNAILGLSSIVRLRTSDPRSQDHLSKVEEAGRQLLTLIDELLDVTRIEANRLKIESQPMRLADVLTRVDVALGAKAAQRGLQLRIESPAELLTREFVGDPLRLQQILTNLVGNAIKFTEQGSIRICLGASPAPDDRTRLRVEVIDTGLGVAAEDQVRIFSLFEQVDAAMTRKYGGAGLGLALCRKLVTLMRGRIGVTSQPGQGSCFWFEIELDGPGARVATASDVDDAKALLRGRFAGARVLVVDDDAINAEVAQLMLEEVGIQADLASDGLAAIERVAARRYALVLMDLQMPGMDGLSATRAIRSLPNGKGIPVVALTARVIDLDAGDCAAAGIDEVIAKPVVAGVFYRRILEVLQKAGQPAV